MTILSDLFSILKGKYSKKISREYKFAFLVHSRGYQDIYRKYPQLKFIPKEIIVFFMHHLWPISLSRVTGVHDLQNQKEIDGYVLGITMTARDLMTHREKALKKIRQALYLAKGKGVKIIGLGGLTSSLSGGGKLLLDIDINITTGHAYTAHNVFSNLLALTEIINVPKEKLKIAIVGAAGSIGSMSATLVTRAGYGSITLIDIKRKSNNLLKLQEELKKINPEIQIIVSYEVRDISGNDFIITATNTPEALITTEIVEDGMIIIDDAQPSDIHSDVLKLENVLVIEAGVVHTPEINSNFNYGLKSRTDNFCCMAELLILASHQWENHFVIERATLEHVDKIGSMGKELGFRIANYQNFMESIPVSKIEHIKLVIKKKYAL